MNDEVCKNKDVKLMMAAMEEYGRDGKVSGVRCDLCGGLLEVTPIGETGRSLSVKCPCGRYKDTMRGL
jgi:hypothetical protein